MLASGRRVRTVPPGFGRIHRRRWPSRAAPNLRRVPPRNHPTIRLVRILAPWVPGRPEKSVGREALERELRDIRLAHEDRPRGAKPPGDYAVAARCCLSSPKERTERCRETRRVLDVLDEQRQAREWPGIGTSADGGVQRFGVGERGSGPDRGNSVQG